MTDRVASRESFPPGIVITGIAAAASLGIDADSIWHAVVAGRCGMNSMPDIESALPPGSVGGQAADLPASYRPDLPREARYLRWTVQHALADAGLAPVAPEDDPRRCAVLGTTLHGMRAGGRFLRSGDAGRLSSFLSSATAHLTLAGLGVGGGAVTTCSACSSSLGAVALGVTLLTTHQADLVVAGGYDAASEYAWAGFNALRLIADGPVRPFCRGRRGMKVAEGYGIVILERAESATRRGATVRAHLAGWGESADSHHLTQPHPQGDGAFAAMRQALSRAAISPRELGMIAAHATGTPDNDEAEFQALSRLLGDALPHVPVTAFKAFLGHALGGAGAVELVLSCQAIRDGRVPGCPGIAADEIEHPSLNLAVGPTATREIHATLNTSLGFGGANTCVVLRRPGHASAPVRGPLTDPPAAWITGVGILLPDVDSHAAFVERALAPEPDTPPRPRRIDDAALAPHLNARRARRMSDYVKHTLAAAAMALRDAALIHDTERLAAASAMLATMHGSASFCHEYYTQVVADGPLAANPVLFAEGVPNAAAAHLSTTFGIRGSCQTIIGSRTAGLDALALAALRVRAGDIDTAIVVAAEAQSDIVDHAYAALGLGRRAPAEAAPRATPGFTPSIGAVAFIVESSRAAAARRAAPYALLLDSARASAHPSPRSGPAAAVASALSRLSRRADVVGSACGNWIDRAERLGRRRAGVEGDPGPVHARFGELFSATPLLAISTRLISGRTGARFSSLCTDWTGAASAMSLELLERRLGAAPQPTEAST